MWRNRGRSPFNFVRARQLPDFFSKKNIWTAAVSSGEIRLRCCACEMQPLLYTFLLRKSRCGKSFSPLLIFFFERWWARRKESNNLQVEKSAAAAWATHKFALIFFISRKLRSVFFFPFFDGKLWRAPFLKGPLSPRRHTEARKREKSGATLGFHLRNSHRRHTHFSFPSQQKKKVL